MKKILFMVSSMDIGGVEKSLLSLLSFIPKDTYDITVLLLDKKGGFLTFIPEGIKVEQAPWFDKIRPIIMQPPQQTIKDYYRKKQFTKILSFTFIYFVSKYLDNRYIYYRHVFKDVPESINTYDLAIAYQGPTDTIDYYIANKVMADKKIAWVHFDVSKFKINNKLYSRLYSKYDAVFAVSEEAGKRLTEVIPAVKEKVDIFYNIISYNLINELSKKPVEFDDDFKGIRIVTVGRLSREKGQDLAVGVLHRLRMDGYNIRWYCIGDGRDRAEYETLIERYNLKKDFILMGSTLNPYPYIAKADIYVQTSRHEGYCMTLAEAKCLHRPIVTTSFTGACEQIINGYNGFIAGIDEEDLYEKIKYLIDNPTQKDSFSKNLRENSISTTGDVYKLLNQVI